MYRARWLAFTYTAAADNRKIPDELESIYKTKLLKWGEMH